MSKVVIVVDAEVEETEAQIATYSTTSRMVSALKQAITSFATDTRGTTQASATVEVVTTSALRNQIGGSLPTDVGHDNNPKSHDILYCPLTLNLPESFNFAAGHVYKACSDVSGLRQWVKQQGIASGTGDLWLPIVLTAKGPLYGEAIGLAAEVSGKELSLDLSRFSSGADKVPYQQPVHLSDVWRQPLYQLGYRLLKFLSAPPSTYLLQFGFQNQNIVFDRLWPFPAAPAIASLDIQTPDLFTCHWYCLTETPIFDLSIIPAKD
ncbi:MAG TPA: hypothetical protein V6D12_16290 [Candidatus Obscuribacterales bacterium]